MFTWAAVVSFRVGTGEANSGGSCEGQVRHVPKVPGSLLDKVSSSSFLCGAGGWGRGEQSGHSLPNRCLSVVGGDQLVPKSNTAPYMKVSQLQENAR